MKKQELIERIVEAINTRKATETGNERFKMVRICHQNEPATAKNYDWKDRYFACDSFGNNWKASSTDENTLAMMSDKTGDVVEFELDKISQIEVESEGWKYHANDLIIEIKRIVSQPAEEVECITLED